MAPAVTGLPDAVARLVVLEAQVAALTAALARVEAQVRVNSARLDEQDLLVPPGSAASRRITER